MAYVCVLDNIDEKYIFPEFSNTIFKAGESNIYYKASQMFRVVYEIFYKIVQQYIKGEWNINDRFLTNLLKSFAYFMLLAYIVSVAPCTLNKG